MTQINPFIPTAIQGTHAQSKPSAARDRQIRRAQNLGKNSALAGDDLEHQVESADALRPIRDQNDSYQPQKRPPPKPKPPTKGSTPDDTTHLDLTA